MKYGFAIYNKLPHWLKEFAAGLYARKLQSYRKDDSSNERIQQAAEREQWSFEEWNAYQQAELEKVLYRAAHHVPYYRQYWQQRGYEKGEWKSLENWPVLTKQELRKYNHLFLAEDCNPKQMYTEYTSGTSGTPLTVYWSKETTLTYYAIFERRIKNWHGVNWNMNYLMLGGRMVVPVTKQKPPFWIRNTYMHQLYLSSYHLSSSTIKAYQQVIESFRPKYMFGYASSMYSLALLAKQQNLELPHLTCAISNAEPILAHQKILIEYVFNTKLVNTYGMSEMVASASSYQQEDLVLWPEIGLMEVLNFENDTPEGVLRESIIIKSMRYRVEQMTW
jgi:phenylacetate-CoA ligase